MEKNAINVIYFQAFLELLLLDISEKCVVTPNFLCGF